MNYKNITLTPEGKFKSNGHSLKFGVGEVELIYENMNQPLNYLTELTSLSDSTVSRLRNAIRNGYFDEYLPIEDTRDYPIREDGVTIRDIHINIYNNTLKDGDSVEGSLKHNQGKIKQWSKKIRERGKYICAKCGRKDHSHNEAHHIFGKAIYPELACDTGNGIVLCQKCHDDYHKRFTGDKVNPYTFIGWINE